MKDESEYNGGMSHDTVRLTRRQVRAVDRRAIEVYGVPGIVLMENAARGAAEVAWEMLGQNVRGGRNVVIVCGSGNNGGDGLAVARHLHNRGVQILVVLAADEFKADAAINWEIVQKMDISRCELSHAGGAFDPGAVDLIVDALFG